MTCKIEKPDHPQFEIPVCPMGTAWCIVDHRRPPILLQPISELELSTRSKNCMAVWKIKTIGDLVQHSEKDLMACKNFGEVCRHEIRQKLADLGLKLSLVDHPLPSDPTPPEHPPIPLVARHCRTCDLVRFGRNDTLPHWESHDAPTPDGVPPTPCPKPDFGPEVVVCEIPW